MSCSLGGDYLHSLVCFDLKYVHKKIPLQRLQGKVIKLVDVSYGGENGFNQAIELAAESLANVKFIQEKKLIGESYAFPSKFLWYFLLNFALRVLDLVNGMGLRHLCSTWQLQYYHFCS